MRREFDPIPYMFPFKKNPWPLQMRVVEYWSYLSLDPDISRISRQYCAVTALGYQDKTEEPN